MTRSYDTLMALIASPSEDCIEWSGARIPEGYGQVSRGGRVLGAHRVAYEVAVGPIPEGRVIDHLCRNTACVNPRHLEPVTNRENILRGFGITARLARQTHCVHGHPLSGDNLRASRGRRTCRTCHRLACARRRAAA